MSDDGKNFWVVAALDYDCDEAFILSSSEDVRRFDVVDGYAVSDSIDWNTKGLQPGLYKLTLRPWAHGDYEGIHDSGVDVERADLLTPFPELAM
jgi:hypothetical protein